MMDGLSRTFADITAQLEDFHSLAVEGQSRDATPDIHRVLICQLRSGLAALNGKLRAMSAVIDGQAR